MPQTIRPKIAVIAGAGPAGLTAATELLRNTDIKPLVFEESDTIGGISRTVLHNGNRIDIGGHRFFSKNRVIMDWWKSTLPMMTRNRISRIYYLNKFFDYPISLSLRTLSNLGLSRTINAGAGYVAANLKKLPETSLENFYINRFGKPLYKMFFEDYTEKVWGIHPSELGADWGSQRVKGLSIYAIIKDVLTKKIGRGKKRNVETSLIEEFIYPKLGPGQLWETVAENIISNGGEIHKSSKVKSINVQENRVISVTVGEQGQEVECDYFLSSMPIKDLINSIRGIDIPADVKQIASTLPYRDFITVGLLLDKLAIENTTSIETFKNRIPDTWIYIQDKSVHLGRIQIFNNWSPYMVSDLENKIWIGLEYFCNEGDSLWEMTDEDFINMAVSELKKSG